MAIKPEHRVEMEVEFSPGWLTWVAATTGCLRALECDVDVVDVAGSTGYAFALAIHEELSPAGPTAFDFGLLEPGIPLLGRSPLAFRGGQHYEGDHVSPVMAEQWQFVYDLVAGEIRAGRPCVLYGPYAPEFAIAVAVGGNHYWVKSFKESLGESQPAVSKTALHAVGGLYVLAFPTITEVDRAEVDRRAIEHAVEMMMHRVGSPWYASGLEGYDLWIEGLRAGKADPFGSAYNARCWAEARSYARAYLARVAGRCESQAGDVLFTARDAFSKTAGALNRVLDLYPLHPQDTWMMTDAGDEAIGELENARNADARALDALQEAIALWQG